jgi:altronate hydrolase
MANRPPVLQLSASDNVAVALRDLTAGEALGIEHITAAETVQRGHKLALRSIAPGEPVRKYGQIIGAATTAIAPGQHVHTHNLVFVPSAADHAIGTTLSNADVLPEPERANFQGIQRANGEVATRNYIGVITTVNCANTVARLIADQFRGPSALERYPNVDGVVALTHTLGCAAGSEGEATDLLRRTIGGYLRHPNFAAVLVIGLGCESNQLDRLLEEQGIATGERVHRYVIQETGGTAKTMRGGVDRIKELLPVADRVERKPLPVSHLKLGLQCGGSDGFSGLTANPALGVASDILVRHGGTSILSETPEIYGAEHTLLARAASRETGEKLLALLKWWEDYARANNESLDNNPSPGNKEGGLTTILEKSLGAAAKGGSANLAEVYRYAEPVTKPGFVFMDTPGYDPVSVTGQVAGGANIVCFTTGRGSCFGCKPAPSLKLATNTPMYLKMEGDMDLNCGDIADGAATLEETGQRIFALILETASGRETKSEELGYGDDEFAPWHLGATL